MTSAQTMLELADRLDNFANRGANYDANIAMREASRFLHAASDRLMAGTGERVTEQMVESGARVAASRRGHKDCDALIATTNAGAIPIWKFYTDEPRAILEAALLTAPAGADVRERNNVLDGG